MPNKKKIFFDLWDFAPIFLYIFDSGDEEIHSMQNLGINGVGYQG